MLRVLVFTLTVLLPAAVIGQIVELPLVKFIGGLEPEKLSNTELKIFPGFTTDSAGNNLIKFPAQTIVNLTTQGCNGLDHSGGPVEGASYQLYTAYNPTTGEACFLLSQSITYGGVIYPPGFQAHKKPRFAYRHRAAWGGIPDFHLSHWPGSPSIRLTGAEADSPYRIAQDLQTSDAWVQVDALPILPDAARMAWVGVQIDNSGSAGTCYLRTMASQSVGIPVGATTPLNVTYPGSMWKLRVTSTGKFFARTTGGCRFKSIYILGYDMTEPS
ncbi:MAG: hypothetical protein GEU99_03940 [Luteitalea sp.]|nr:hypothetical protein [Luteitalea sp.]